MLHKYKEIVFGVLFGVAAMLFDTAMDATAEGHSVAEELAAHPGMVLYRLGFILLGLVLGWLLWRNHKRDREFRQLEENFRTLQRQCGTHGLLLRSNLQLVLTRDDLHLSDEARKLLLEAFQKTEALQGLAEDTIPAIAGKLSSSN